MANLGNAWHIPGNPEPRGRGGMRDPIGAIVAEAQITFFSGNQFQGAGTTGNQLQVGSTLFYKRVGDAAWTAVPMVFETIQGNNKYYRAQVPSNTFQTGNVIQYYFQIPYSDRDTTFLFDNGGISGVTGDQATAQRSPYTFAVESSAVRGAWGTVFDLPNVAIHSSLLPNGKVLMWGRRDLPAGSLDDHFCTPFVWDPKNGTTVPTPQPAGPGGVGTVNLFCSGHTFLPDGRLLVVGGHLFDGDGLDQASLFDWRTNQWTATAPMTDPQGNRVRRWYPTAVALPDGRVLVLSGSYIDANRRTIVADLLQIWNNGIWETIPKADGAPLNFIGLPLYPRMHVLSGGDLFMAGPNDRTLRLTTSAPGVWTEVAFRNLGNRDYCPAALFDADKILYIGGGNDAGTHAPTDGVETIDLGQAAPRWIKITAMAFRRRQHNATMLPDGTILVTGGTRGGGGPNIGFNDTSAGQPVHTAELFDPAAQTWTTLSAEQIDRCYHATAVLLPDARVLSAGGGEYRPDNINTNDPADTHRDGQIFSPPYLFKGARPVITSAPGSVTYGQTFTVNTPDAAQIAKVSLIRLASVTHSFDQSQHFSFLAFTPGAVAATLTVTAPPSANHCPPGHYMLFLVSATGVPSVAEIIQLQAAAAPVLHAFAAALPSATAPSKGGAKPLTVVSASSKAVSVYQRAAEMASSKGTAIIVGITGTCPYGIGACWGGAYEALGRMDGDDKRLEVGPIPNVDDSTATIYLSTRRLPSFADWEQRFERIANGSYVLRGFEATLQGAVEAREGNLYLKASGGQPRVLLVPLTAGEKIQWNHTARSAKPLTGEESQAFERLRSDIEAVGNSKPATVIGPIRQTDKEYRLYVRVWLRDPGRC